MKYVNYTTMFEELRQYQTQNRFERGKIKIFSSNGMQQYIVQGWLINHDLTVLLQKWYIFLQYEVFSKKRYCKARKNDLNLHAMLGTARRRALQEI